MGESSELKSMPLWLILSPERFIKKSIQDNSLAVFEDERDAKKQISKISEANSETCTIEEFALCSKDKLSKYTEIHNEMYEMLRRFLPYVTYDENGEEVFHGGDFEWNECDDPMIDELKELLAKARGEL